MDTPFGYWYRALEEVAVTLQRADPTMITDTKAIRKAIFAPDEAVTSYITSGDNEAVTLFVLTNFRRVVQIRFAGDTARHLSIPLSRITFHGGAIDGITSRVTEAAAFNAVAFRFVLDAAEPIELTLPMSIPHSVAGREEIEFAQQLLGALYGDATR
jgi:hypothetical protein